MTNEAKTWTRMVEALWKPNRVLNRIENGVLDGMPDTHFCIDGAMGWIEIKSPTEPARDKTPLFGSNHKLSIAQRNWLLAYVQAGGAAWVGIETDERMLLVHGRHADIVNRSTVSDLCAVADFHALRPLKPDSWAELLFVITQHKAGKS